VTEHSTHDDEADARDRLMLAAFGGVAGVLAAIVFVGWPALDLAASRAFYLGPRHFLLNDSELADAFRTLFTFITWSAGILAGAGILLAVAQRRHLFGLRLPHWLFLALSLALGSGLVANAVLKDHWARPRPLHIVEFGGPHAFTPVLDRTGQCDRNCSFISGETSSILAIGFAVAMLVPRRRRAMAFAVALAAGAAIGLIRIGEGGHFLSDVIFAGVLMALVVVLVHWLIFDVLRDRLGDEALDRAVSAAQWLQATATRLAFDMAARTSAAAGAITHFLRDKAQGPPA
jgi:lipid A 4'-phosphatase